MPAASVPQKACPFQNSNAAQPAQKTTSAMRRHNGLKNDVLGVLHRFADHAARLNGALNHWGIPASRPCSRPLS